MWWLQLGHGKSRAEDAGEGCQTVDRLSFDSPCMLNIVVCIWLLYTYCMIVIFSLSLADTWNPCNSRWCRGFVLFYSLFVLFFSCFVYCLVLFVLFFCMTKKKKTLCLEESPHTSYRILTASTYGCHNTLKVTSSNNFLPDSFYFQIKVCWATGWQQGPPWLEFW